MPFTIFDGKKSYSDEDVNHWRTLSNNTTETYKLYTHVPYLYRAVDIRARAVASFPYRVLRNGQDVTDNELFTPIVNAVTALLYRTEAAICLYGRAYWTKDVTNRIPTPVWLLPTLVYPQYQTGKGLTRYDYYAGVDSAYSGKHIQFNPDELVRFELPSLGTEGWYGVAPAYVASSSADTLYGIDTFARGYFDRGAIKATVLAVEGNPSQKHKDELKNWFESLLTGVRKAWSTAVLSDKVNPVVIGAGIEELKDNDITERREEHICAALGVPISMVRASAANYATAFSERLNFVTYTVLPEIEFIFNTINDQVLNTYGLTLDPQPNKLEVMQQAELEKAQALSTLVKDEKVMTVNEARALLELAEIEVQPEVRKQLTEELLQTGAFSKNEIRAFFGLEQVDTTDDTQQQELSTFFNLVSLGVKAGLPIEQVVDMVNKRTPRTVTAQKFLKSVADW